MDKVPLTLVINGNTRSLSIDPSARLLDVIRDTLGLTGTKEGCGEGECGACTILLNGRAVNSCLVLALQADGSEVKTIEGLDGNGELHLIQKAFVEAGGIQCGFCTPGFIMSTYALLDDNPNPTREEIGVAFEGNICRCTGYKTIVEAVELAARFKAQEKGL